MEGKEWGHYLRLSIPILALTACAAGDSIPVGVPLFTDITADVGLDFIHQAGVDSSFYMPEIGGAGAAFLDFDNDGDLDIYLVNGGSHAGSAKEVSNRLYRQDADGKLTDVTEFSGLGDTGYGMGVAVGDIDNDGFVDVYVSNVGPDALYRNLGDGSFQDISATAGINNSAWSSSIVFFDYDRDGLLDIYITNYLKLDANVTCPDPAGRPDYCGPASFDGVADVLYHNLGNGRFADVSVSSGIASGGSKGLGVISADFNDDLYPDLYVANDGEANHLWINNRDGTFTDQASASGVALSGLGRPEAGMGIAFADLEDDGDFDLFVTHFRGETNTLYRAVENGYRDESSPAGMDLASRPRTGFGTGFFDFDNDGDLDLVVVNGGVVRGATTVMGAGGYWDAYSEPNLLFENRSERGNGIRFVDVSSFAPDLTADIASSRGLAFGDFDNDGGVDLLLNNAGGGARLLRNSGPRGHWLLVRLVDPEQGGNAYGTMVTVSSGRQKMRRVVAPAYSYQSSNDVRVHFGLGESEMIDELEVKWPDGTTETYSNIGSDQRIVITKGAGTLSIE